MTVGIPTHPRAVDPRIPAHVRTVTTFDTDTRRVDESGNLTWIVRTAYFGLVMTRIERRTSIRVRTVEETMLVAPASLRVAITSDAQRLSSDGDTLFIVPPGESTIEVDGNGYLARIVGAGEREALANAINAVDYENGAPELGDFITWPTPPDGFRLRRYCLDEYVDAQLPGRAFRCTNLMVNITDIYPGKRDSSKLKPHSHDDFEQITLTYAGRFAHHLRTPWGVDSTRWQPDEHLDIDSPAAIVLPAGLIHTSQALEAGCWLIDIFGPPRMDFSLMQGFVRNGDEYPQPPRP